jgi:nitrate/nitrite transporter NarK
MTDASGSKSAGAAAGLTNAIWQSGSAMAPLVVGQVYGRTHSFSLALMTLAAGPVVAAITLLFIRSAPTPARAAEHGAMGQQGDVASVR